MTRSLFLLLVIVTSNLGVAQSTNRASLPGFDFLTLDNQLPTNMRSTRSAVILYTPIYERGKEIRGDWKLLGKRVHRSLRQMGLDAVAYFYEKDIASSPAAQKAFSKICADRSIANLIRMTFVEDRYELTVTKFNRKHNFVDFGQSCWKSDNPNLTTTLLNLGIKVKEVSEGEQNFLIAEVPQFYDDVNLFDGLKLANYPGQVRRLKTAIPTFDSLEFPKDANKELISKIEMFNEDVRQKNNKLKDIFSKYPYPYEFVPPTDDEDLYKQGYQFVLRYLNTTGEHIKKMLNYDMSGNETRLISVKPDGLENVSLLSLSTHTEAFKYYFKQTIAKDAYVGKEWDSDITWHEAMENFIGNMLQAHNE
ncbi:MAG: hypothetical protein KI790_15815 [Cyclobacteriaceae bacterium]|nr:hypothetical protein [Cyclobacteriaceae bacterium HetDA_MAG_MS6]